MASFWKFWVYKFQPQRKKNKKKTVESRDIWLIFLSRSTERQARHDGKTCYWLILKKAELTNIFVHVFFFFIFIFGKYGFFRILSVYLFSQMQCKRKFSVHRISSSKCWASNKRCPLISAAFLGIHIEISASLKEALPL